MKHLILALCLLPNAAALADDELDALLARIRVECPAARRAAERVSLTDTGIGGTEHFAVSAPHGMAKSLAVIAESEWDNGAERTQIFVSEGIEHIKPMPWSIGDDWLFITGPRERWPVLVREGVRAITAMRESTVPE